MVRSTPGRMRAGLLVPLVLALLGSAPAAAERNNNNPGVIPNVASPLGTSYGEWGAAWWQWAAAIPAGMNPILDETGEYCAVGQSDRVWFLAGTAGLTGVQRTCTVPAGKMLFFPIINVALWPPDCVEEEDCRELVTGIMDLVDVLEVTVDGVPLQDLEQYRADSAPFTIEVADGLQDFGFGEPGVFQPAVSDGFWVMLAPLSPGLHEISFRGGVTSFPFETEVTYDLHVRGGPR